MTAAGSPDGLLDARVMVERRGFTLDVAIRVPAGEVVALLGPNGAGKTTVLRALAGLLPLSGGRVALAGRVLDDPVAGVFQPPERRGIGMVFQEYLLFPHLSVLDNVAFGPRCAGAGRAASRVPARRWLERVGLGDRADARPGRLSGGEAQRVALARALATGPRLLLLDEPLAALDVGSRAMVRARLRGYLARHDGATILVTHDPLDAMTLADRIVVLERGRVAQEGEATQITRHPRTEYVARLAGLNLYRGTGSGRVVTLDNGFRFTVAGTVEGETFVAFPPSVVALHRQEPSGSPRNVWATIVAGVERYGDSVRVHLSGVVDVAADVTPAAASELTLAPGARVFAAVKAVEVRAYPAEPGRQATRPAGQPTS